MLPLGYPDCDPDRVNNGKNHGDDLITATAGQVRVPARPFDACPVGCRNGVAGWRAWETRTD
jgi:hypothetical protein